MPESNETIAFLATIQHLKLLPRTGWLFAGIPQPESVAEHSFSVSWLALCLAEQINTDWEAQGLTEPLKLTQVMQIAMVHDLAESVLTDLPKRSAELLGKAAKHAAEATVIQDLFSRMPNGAHYSVCWHDYANGVTPEGRLVRDADKLEMIHQALCYEQSGHRDLSEFWAEQQWHYPCSRNLFEELCRLRTKMALSFQSSSQPI